MLDGKRILIVEDDPHDAELIRASLINSHCIFEVSSSLDEARERAETFLPIIVILDIGLPRSREDGVIVQFSEILAFIRTMRSKSAVVLLTGNVQTDQVEAAMAAGAVDYISKDIIVQRESFEPRIKEAYTLYLAIQTNEANSKILRNQSRMNAILEILLKNQKLSLLQTGKAQDQKEELLKKQMFDAGRKHEREIVHKRQLMAWGAFVASLWGFGKGLYDFFVGWHKHG